MVQRTPVRRGPKPHGVSPTGRDTKDLLERRTTTGGAPPPPPRRIRMGIHQRRMESPPPKGMHWKGGRLPPPPPLEGAHPLPSHCPPHAKCRLQWNS